MCFFGKLYLRNKSFFFLKVLGGHLLLFFLSALAFSDFFVCLFSYPKRLAKDSTNNSQGNED